MAIALADILDQRQVALQLRSRGRPSAIREIVSLFAKTGSVARSADFLAQVLAWEEAGSTLAENGVALPHARTELVDQITLAIGRSHAGIPWNDQGERARLIFLLAVPQRLVNNYLVLIGTLAPVARDQQQRDALFAVATPAEFIAILREAGSF
jgi:mannitol/fructose-specific phosphotransferase system IIA component (Ntr-type)